MERGEDFTTLQKRFANFQYIQTDVPSEGSIETEVDQVIQETRKIDEMVANAGMEWAKARDPC
jgi:NADP-dependent 3-hydroxy acid dehydrogenase YdfG